MAADTDSEMKSASETDVSVENYRKLVQNYLKLHLYKAALFWADKVVALTSGDPRDVYWLAQCMFSLKEFHRAAHLIRSRGLDKTYILCNYLAVRCLLESKDLAEAIKVLEVINADGFIQNPSTSTLNASATVSICTFDDTPKHQIQSSVLLLKGKVLEAMDNLGLAADCYKKALQYDVHCYEAFDALIKHQMLTAREEKELIDSLPISEQCTSEESQMLLILYESRMKKYHTLCSKEIKMNALLAETKTPSGVFMESTIEKVEQESSNINNALCKLHDSLDMVVSEAERLYYNCEYKKCTDLTESVLKKDPYHSGCLPIHISCQVELKQSNKLFSLAHKLVNLYPDLPISWFAVGCYYYVIGKSDFARRYLAKATSLDHLFGPAWLAYGHSFAVENEHDQAMAAYFKASQLMKGCHLPILYIGLECGLTNNVRLAEKFFQQALGISPSDPFVMHEMGVIAFQNLEFEKAEMHFKDALQRVRKNYDTLLANKWEPLLNNLGHTCRKLKKYEEALEYHHQALVMSPQSASTYSAIGYIKSLMGDVYEAVDWFHRALSLRRDDTFSTTMLNYVIEQLADDAPPYPDAPDLIPDFKMDVAKANETSASGADAVSMEESVSMSITNPGAGEMSMSFEVDIPDSGGFIKE